MRVGLTFDRSACGQALSSETKEIAAALVGLGYEVALIGSAKDLVDKLAAGASYDLVFNCLCDGGVVSDLLAVYGIACTGSASATIHLCQQLSGLKSLLRDRGVPTTDYWLVETLGDIPRVDAAYPVTVTAAMSCTAIGSSGKPALEAGDVTELSKACCQLMSEQNSPVIVQPKLVGACLRVGLLGSGGSATVLMPNDIDSVSSKAVERTALAAWRTVRGYDLGCLQLQCDADGVPHVLGVDTQPSLAGHSALVELATAAGLTVNDLVATVMRSATQRAGLPVYGTSLQPHFSQQTKSASRP